MPSDMHQVSSEGEPTYCPRGVGAARWLRSVETGATFPPSCRTWTCVVCGPRRLRRTARAIDTAGYQFWVTLTRAPSDARQGVARVRYLLAKSAPLEWIWTLERGRKTGMIHAHLCLRATSLDYAHVSHCARRAGWGRVAWCRRVLVSAHAGQYAAKAAYAAKGALRPDAWAEHIALNEGRGWHVSRGYTDGMPLRDWVAWYARASDPGPWIWVPNPGATLGE